MYYKVSIQQRALLATLIGVVGFSIFLYFTSSPTLKQNQLVESIDSIGNPQQNSQSVLLEGLHYGYVSLDSIKTLTKKLSNFNNSKRISSNRITSKASINVRGYEYEFFGKEDGEQWRLAYKESLEAADVFYDEKEGLLTMKYDKGCVLIPYQILMQLTLVVDKQNNNNRVKKQTR